MIDNRYFAQIARENAAIATANGDTGIAFCLNLEADELERRADIIDAKVARSWELTLEAVAKNQKENGPFNIFK